MFFSAWNAVLNKSVTMYFRHEQQIKTQWNAIDENIDFLLYYNVILVCNLHVNAGILHYYIFFYSLGHFPVLLCTTKLAQSPSQYYFVLQSLHKLLPTTSWRYAMDFPLSMTLGGRFNHLLTTNTNNQKNDFNTHINMYIYICIYIIYIYI